MRVTAPAADSAVARLVRLVEEAQAARSGVERMVETFAKHYTPAVILAAALLATVPYAIGERGLHYAYTACVLLVVACPCALVLSTPVVAVCGLTRAARRGMLVKGSAHLERLVGAAQVESTGTHSLKGAWFQPSSLGSGNSVSKFAFSNSQLVPLQPGAAEGGLRGGAVQVRESS